MRKSGPVDARPAAKGCYATALRKASRRVSQFYDAELEPSGLKTTQFALLSTVERHGPLTVGALAGAMVMDPGGLAHTLKPLVRDGMLTVSVDPSDKRSRKVDLTPEGRARIGRARAHFDAAQARFEAAFGKPEADALRSAVSIIADDDFLSALRSDPRSRD